MKPWNMKPEGYERDGWRLIEHRIDGQRKWSLSSPLGQITFEIDGGSYLAMDMADYYIANWGK